MERYILTTYDKNRLSSYPMIISIHGKSWCCKQARILVQSMDGGFITANCMKCNNKTNVLIDEFQSFDRDVNCPKCGMVMSPAYVPDGSKIEERNYGFKCMKCDIYIWASDLIPYYEDFPYR